MANMKVMHTLQASPCCLVSRLGAAKATARRVAKTVIKRILKIMIIRFEDELRED